MRQNRALAWLLAAALTLPAVPVRAAAAPETPEKEEVVYINLSPAGQTEMVDVVNIFDLDQPGQIVDYGDYESVRNMTTTDPVIQQGDRVTIDAGAGRLYYEGRLHNGEMPWIIDLAYYLDGAETDPAALAGRSGALKVRLTVRENPRCPGDFFENYALQASFTLDTARCRNIRAEGATAANVGSDKQLTYTILPGRGADISFTADVTDFEMEAAAINGVPLSLDVEVDDEALLGKVGQLTDAVGALNEGAAALSGGVAELADGAGGELASGADKLAGGAAALQSGAAALQSGGSSVRSGAYSVSTGAGSVSEGAQALKGGLDQLGAGLGALNEQSGALRDGSAAVLSGLQTLQNGLADGGISDEDIADMSAMLETLSGQLDSVSGALSGMSGLSQTLGSALGTFQNAYSALNGIISGLGPEDPLREQLGGVLSTLEGGIGAYATALMNLAAAAGGIDTDALQQQLAAAGGYLEMLKGLTGSLGTLKSGVDELVSQYTLLDQGIRDYTDGVSAACDGYDALAPGASDLAAGSAELASGAAALYGGAADLAGGISSVYEASGTLSSGASELNGGVGALVEGINALGEGAAELEDGTAQMAAETEGMDGKIQEEIDGLLSSVTGGGSGEISSFVSEKNTAVRSVQFVIRTRPIEKPTPAAQPPEPEEETGFWEKLKALF